MGHVVIPVNSRVNLNIEAQAVRILQNSLPTIRTTSAQVILAASMMSAIGAAFFLLLPLLLGVLAEEFRLADAEIGLLGSAYLAGFTLVSSSAVVWITRVSWHRSTLSGLVLLVGACLLLTAIGGFRALAAVLFFLGGGAGAVFAVATRVLSAAKNPDRAFGIKLVAEQLLGASLLFVLPAFVLPRWGLDGLVAVVVVTFVVLGLFLFKLPENSARAESGPKPVSIGRNVDAWIGLAGLLVFMLGLSGVWAFIERIADSGGLTPDRIGAMLSLGVLFGGAGAAIAAFLGDRFGHKLPQIIGATLLLLCLYLLSGDLNVLRFGVAASLLSGMWNFMLAYQMASVARADASLRLTVLIAPAIAIGATLGPGIAGAIKPQEGFGSIFMLAVACLLLALALFIVLDMRTSTRSSS